MPSPGERVLALAVTQGQQRVSKWMRGHGDCAEGALGRDIAVRNEEPSRRFLVLKFLECVCAPYYRDISPGLVALQYVMLIIIIHRQLNVRERGILLPAAFCVVITSLSI